MGGRARKSGGTEREGGRETERERGGQRLGEGTSEEELGNIENMRNQVP